MWDTHVALPPSASPIRFHLCLSRRIEIFGFILSSQCQPTREGEREVPFSKEGTTFPRSKDFPDYASDNYFSIRGGEMSRIKTRSVVE